MTPAPRPSTLRAVGAVLLLQAVAGAPLPCTGVGLALAAVRPQPDVACALALAAIGAAVGRGRAALRLGTFALLLARVVAAADTLVPQFLERQFALADVRELPGVWHLFLHDRPLWLQIAAVAGAAVGLAALWLLFAACLRTAIAAVPSPRSLRRGLIALQGLVLLGVAAGSVEPARSLWQPSGLGALARAAAREFAAFCNPTALDGAMAQRLRDAAQRLQVADPGLPGLQGADVHLLFVESYGRVVQRHPQLRARMTALYAQLGEQLAARGFAVRSTACFPEVSGGGSWLTHAQLYASVPVPDRFTFDRVVASTLQPLPKRFQAAGYRTIEVLPAMHRHWPEGAMFYGFDAALTQQELDYRGTQYHWGKMPDQFALHALLRREIEPARGPLLTSFVSVTSHSPFTLTPPFVADWRIDADTFAGPPAKTHPITWLNVLQDPRAVDAYGDAIEYALRTAIGFACQLTRPSLVLVLGDHQPPITSSLEPPDRSRDVLLHVLTNRPHLLAPLAPFPLVEGFAVPESTAAFSTVELAPGLLRAYSR